MATEVQPQPARDSRPAKDRRQEPVPQPIQFQHLAAKSAATVEPPHIVGGTMDPLAARVRCLDIADSLCDEDCDAGDILAIASQLWDWVMDPFKLVDANAPDEDDETATRQ